ncbi:unnamed protein product, partial [Brassica oleracea]
ESCHVSPINQPIKYHFSATSPISFPKRLVSISIVFSSFLLIQKRFFRRFFKIEIDSGVLNRR